MKKFFTVGLTLGLLATPVIGVYADGVERVEDTKNWKQTLSETASNVWHDTKRNGQMLWKALNEKECYMVLLDGLKINWDLLKLDEDDLMSDVLNYVEHKDYCLDVVRNI